MNDIKQIADSMFSAMKDYVGRSVDELRSQVNEVRKQLSELPAPKDGAPGVDGRDGVKGESGKDGLHGQDGRPGTNGRDGAEGKKGDKGERGEPGPAGKDGSNGVDGKSVDPADIERMVSERVEKAVSDRPVTNDPEFIRSVIKGVVEVKEQEDSAEIFAKALIARFAQVEHAD